MSEFNQRRLMLQGAALGAASLLLPRGAFAEKLAARPTAKTTEGPFYPDKMPLDTDNDLIIINNSITPAVGQITHLSGRILGPTGEPLRNAFVEIWQVDSTASYVHTKGHQPTGNEPNFQGYGRFLTDSEGRYYFRTIKPISYTLLGIYRTAHIHFAVSRFGKRVLTTQLFVKGLKDNDTDGEIKRIVKADPTGLDTIMVDFKPLKGSTLNELAGNFDAILNRTVMEGDDGKLHTVAPPEDGTGALPPPRKS
ncbi:MAG: dioxygenase family protein [Rhodospirillaceae bacterium]